MKKIFLYIFLFLPLISLSQSINPYAKNFTVSDGLPSMECYEVIQDYSGYIWIATDRGVARFDGYNFTNFTTADGLTDIVILHLFCDYKNRVWMAGLNGTLCYAENGKIFPYRFSDSLKKMLPKGGLILKFFCDEDDNLVFGISTLGILVIDAKGNISIKSDREENYLSFLQEKSNIVSDHSFLSNINGIKSTTDGREEKFSLPIISIKGDAPHAAVLPSGSIVMTIGTHLLFIDFNHLPPLQYQSPVQPIFIYPESDSSVWISQFSNGGISRLYWNRAKNTVRLTRQCFADVTVSSMCTDSAGGFWFTTLANGLYYVPSFSTGLLSAANKSLSSKNITGLAQRKDGTLLFSTEKEIFVYRNDSVFLSKQYQPESSKLIGNILTDDNLLYVIRSSDNKLFDLKGGMVPNKIQFYMTDFIADSSGIFITASGCFQFNNALTSLPTRAILSDKRCDAILKAKDGKIWIGSVDGLAFLDKSLLPHFINDPLLSGTRVKDMLLEPNGNFVIAGLGKGIIFWDQKNAAHLLDHPLNRELQLTNCIAVDSAGVIWAGTNQGLYRISENETGKYDVTKIGSSDGIPLTDVRKICVYHGKIFLLCHEGILIYDPRKEKPILKPVPVYFGKIKSENEIFSPAALSKIPYDKRELSIQFKGIDYSQDGKINYRYRLKAADTAWIYSTNTQIDFPKLLPNDYTLQVEAQNANGKWNAKPAQLSFTILKPWWQETWFYLLVALILVFLVIMVIRYRYQSRLNAEQQKRKSVESELAALRSQMNPHFIFNALNAIQDFIFQHKSDEANEYLVKFSKLIRLILTQSRKQVVSVEEELELLRYYLQLEALRFDQKFSWNIMIAPEINPAHTFIPSLLLQPIVENSVNHGFKGLSRPGILSITLSQSNSKLNCVIEDNGKGRSASSEKKQDHLSLAMKIAKERIHTFNQLHQEKISFNIEDLTDESGNATGTRTIFVFQQNLSGNR